MDVIPAVCPINDDTLLSLSISNNLIMLSVLPLAIVLPLGEILKHCTFFLLQELQRLKNSL